MNVSLMPFAAIGTILVIAVIALFIWRKVVASNEDDTIHVLEDAVKVPEQVAVAEKLEKIDKWGKMLTVITVIYVIAFAVLFVYQQWVQQSKSVM